MVPLDGDKSSRKEVQSGEKIGLAFSSGKVLGSKVRVLKAETEQVTSPASNSVEPEVCKWSVAGWIGAFLRVK